MNDFQNFNCTYCGNKIPSGSVTCPSCGAQAPAQPVGPEVGSQPGAPPSSGSHQYGENSAGGGFAPPPSGGPLPSGGVSFGGVPSSSGGPVLKWTSFIWAFFVIVMIGLGVYTNQYGCGFPSGCVNETPVPIALNQTLQGDITTFHTYRLYELQIVQPTQVQINAISSWDNYLELYFGTSEQPMVTDDDGGQGLNAQITTSLVPGEYYILVRPYSEGTGDFTISVVGSPLGVQTIPGQPGYPPQ